MSLKLAQEKLAQAQQISRKLKIRALNPWRLTDEEQAKLPHLQRSATALLKLRQKALQWELERATKASSEMTNSRPSGESSQTPPET